MSCSCVLLVFVLVAVVVPLWFSAVGCRAVGILETSWGNGLFVRYGIVC